MSYTVQSGDTIAKVTDLLDSTWKELKAANPKAVGRSLQNGNWFLREGKTVSASARKTSFNDALDVARQKRGRSATTAKTARYREENHVATDHTAAGQATTGQEIHHVIQPGETIWRLATQTYGVDPDALQQFNGIGDPRRLQPGQVLRIPEHLPPFQPPPLAVAMDDSQKSTDDVDTVTASAATAATTASDWEEAIGAAAANMVGKAIKVVASWYGQYHHGRAMANGEPFNMYASTIAHKDLPLGAKVRLENPETGERVIATVTDRGPFIKGRDIDLSYGVAKRLSLAKEGVGNLLMTIL